MDKGKGIATATPEEGARVDENLPFERPTREHNGNEESDRHAATEQANLSDGDGDSSLSDVDDGTLQVTAIINNWKIDKVQDICQKGKWLRRVGHDVKFLPATLDALEALSEITKGQADLVRGELSYHYEQRNHGKDGKGHSVGKNWAVREGHLRSHIDEIARKVRQAKKGTTVLKRRAGLEPEKKTVELSPAQMADEAEKKECYLAGICHYWELSGSLTSAVPDNLCSKAFKVKGDDSHWSLEFLVPLWEISARSAGRWSEIRRRLSDAIQASFGEKTTYHKKKALAALSAVHAEVLSEIPTPEGMGEDEDEVLDASAGLDGQAEPAPRTVVIKGKQRLEEPVGQILNIRQQTRDPVRPTDEDEGATGRPFAAPQAFAHDSPTQQPLATPSTGQGMTLQELMAPSVNTPLNHPSETEHSELIDLRSRIQTLNSEMEEAERNIEGLRSTRGGQNAYVKVGDPQVTTEQIEETKLRVLKKNQKLLELRQRVDEIRRALRRDVEYE